MGGILDVVAIACDTLAPIACCVCDTAKLISMPSTDDTKVDEGSLPVPDALADVVDAIAYTVDKATSHLACASDVALDLLAEPVVTHFV
jgi:hypothetical protein